MGDALDRTRLSALHERLLHGDRLASEEVVRATVPALSAELAQKFRRADEHLVYDGVADAILDYCARPQQYDPGREVPLDRFLAGAAGRNISNLLRGEGRRKRREQLAGRERREADVGLDPAAGNIRREEREELARRRAALFAALNDAKDREVLDLYLKGVRDSASFARVLGITDRPIDEQREGVRRHKDRILRFLRRKGLLP